MSLHNDPDGVNGNAADNDAGNVSGLANPRNATRPDCPLLVIRRPVYTADPTCPDEVCPEHPDEWRR